MNFLPKIKFSFFKRTKGKERVIFRESLNEKLERVQKESGWFLINKETKEEKGPFNFIDDICNDTIRAQGKDKNKLWFYFDKEGNQIGKEKFEEARRFTKDGIARVKKNGKWSFLTREGNYLTKEKFDYAWKFSEGMAAVKMEGKYYYIDKSGKLIGDGFDDIREFHQGKGYVKKQGKWYTLDKEGNLKEE
jgi:hypothetical protein